MVRDACAATDAGLAGGAGDRRPVGARLLSGARPHLWPHARAVTRSARISLSHSAPSRDVSAAFRVLAGAVNE
jgi:hypothetical protein